MYTQSYEYEFYSMCSYGDEVELCPVLFNIERNGE